jgi:hypothetical protein
MSSDKDVRYGVWDNVTDEGLSRFSGNPDEWEWNVDLGDGFGNLASNFHLFESLVAAQNAIEILTKSFLEQDSENKINFVIYELTNPKTVTTYLAKEIKSHKPSKAKKSKKR